MLLSCRCTHSVTARLARARGPLAAPAAGPTQRRPCQRAFSGSNECSSKQVPVALQARTQSTPSSVERVEWPPLCVQTRRRAQKVQPPLKRKPALAHAPHSFLQAFFKHSRSRVTNAGPVPPSSVHPSAVAVAAALLPSLPSATASRAAVSASASASGDVPSFQSTGKRQGPVGLGLPSKSQAPTGGRAAAAATSARPTAAADTNGEADDDAAPTLLLSPLSSSSLLVLGVLSQLLALATSACSSACVLRV